MSQRHATADDAQPDIQGSYAATFSERRRPPANLPSPRSERSETKSREASSWNKSVRVAASHARRAEGNLSPRQSGPTSPTARRFHSPRVRAPLAAPPSEGTAPTLPVQPNGVAATGPSWQTRSLFQSANELEEVAASAVNVAAATAASTTWSAGSQAALVQQLRDVVLKLSQGAAEETQEAVNTQKRFEAYTELVHEQDRIINELRADNARLQRERDTLLEFRHQNLQRDMRLLSGRTEEHTSLTKTPILDELVQLEFAKCNGLKPTAAVSLLNESLTAQTRNLVRSLAAQLYDERARRFDVEEKSSLLVGQQQSLIDTLEQRLRRAHPSPQRSPRFAAPSTTARLVVADTSATRRGDLDSPTLSSSTSSTSLGASKPPSPPHAPVEHVYARRHSDPMNTAQRRVVGQLARQLDSAEQPVSTARLGNTPPLSPRGEQGASPARTPTGSLLRSTKDPVEMSPSEAYDDASTILAAIRQKYGL